MAADADDVRDDVADAKSSDSEKSNDSKSSDKLMKELREVREEAKNYRLKNKAVNSEFELYKLENETKFKSIEAEKLSLQANLDKYKGSDKRIVETELKLQAVLSGIKDTDLVKLIDTSKIEISEDGSINQEALKTAINTLKEAKPFLFGEEKKSSTSSNASTSAKASDSKIDVMKMTRKEWDEQKAKFLRGGIAHLKK